MGLSRLAQTQAWQIVEICIVKNKAGWQFVVPFAVYMPEKNMANDTSVVSDKCDNSCLLYVSTYNGILYKCWYKKEICKNRSKNSENVT